MKKIFIIFSLLLFLMWLLISVGGDWWYNEPVAYWTFDSTTIGDNATDISNNGHDCNDTAGRLNWTDGKLNGAVQFNDTTVDGDLLNCGASIGLEDEDWTIALWVKNISNVAETSYIVSDGFNTNGAWAIRISNTNGTIEWVGNDDVGAGGIYCRLYSNQSLMDSLWHRVVVVKNVTNNTMLYVDNVELDTKICNESFSGGSNNFIFGYSAGTNLVMDLDDVAIYNSAWTTTQVDTDWNSGSGKGAEDDYDYTFNSVTYNSTAWEGTNEGFNINFTYNYTKWTSTPVVYLNYSGTHYLASKISDDNVGTVTYFKSLAVSTGTNSFVWNITLSDGSSTHENQSAIYTQTVSEPLFFHCNATDGNAFINFTFQEEDTSVVLSAAIQDFDITFWTDDQTVNNTYTYSNSTENLDYAFCYLPSDETVNNEYDIQYTKVGYVARRYADNTALTNTTTNRILYLLNASDGIYSTYQVQDSGGNTIEGVTVQVEKEISGTWTLIEESTTDAAGAATFWLNPDYDHRLTFTKTGYTSEQVTLRPSQSTYTIYLSSTTSAATVSDYSQGISWSLLPNNYTLNNNTDYSFSLIISSATWDLTEYGIILRNETSDELGSTTGSTSTGSTINIVQNTLNYSRIIMDYYWIVEGNYTNGSTQWYVADLTDEGFGLSRFFTDLKNFTDQGMFGLNEFSRTILIFLFIFVVIGVLSYTTGVYSPAAIMWELFALVAFFNWLDLIPTVDGAFQYLPTLIVGVIALTATFLEVQR